MPTQKRTGLSRRALTGLLWSCAHLPTSHRGSEGSGCQFGLDAHSWDQGEGPSLSPGKGVELTSKNPGGGGGVVCDAPRRGRGAEPPVYHVVLPCTTLRRCPGVRALGRPMGLFQWGTTQEGTKDKRPGRIGHSGQFTVPLGRVARLGVRRGRHRGLGAHSTRTLVCPGPGRDGGSRGFPPPRPRP